MKRFKIKANADNVSIALQNGIHGATETHLRGLQTFVLDAVSSKMSDMHGEA
jgi:hypothetical protein